MFILTTNHTTTTKFKTLSNTKIFICLNICVLRATVYYNISVLSILSISVHYSIEICAGINTNTIRLVFYCYLWCSLIDVIISLRHGCILSLNRVRVLIVFGSLIICIKLLIDISLSHLVLSLVFLFINRYREIV